MDKSNSIEYVCWCKESLTSLKDLTQDNSFLRCWKCGTLHNISKIKEENYKKYLHSVGIII